jgi:D-alanyl-D-alanine carboxypeptidase/D-alanyl-D-alanine-endopeptidase (penicillin-binding protein 4)
MRSAPWRLLISMIALVTGCVPATLAPTPAFETRQSLRAAIDSMLAAPDVRHARFGILIVDPARGDTLYAHDASKLLVPASNQKIITSAVALDALGPDYRFRTPFVTRGEIRDSTLDGDLLIVGRGDPSVSDRVVGDAMVPLLAVADALRARGIRRITGTLIAHGNAFPDANIGYAWEHDDLSTTSGAPIDELLFNEGVSSIEVRAGKVGEAPAVRTAPARSYPRVRITATTTLRGTGRDSLAQLTAIKDTARGEVVVSGTIPVGDSASLTVTHRDPGEAFVAAAREAFRARGIVVGDSAMAPNSTRSDTLAVIESPPLMHILAHFMKPSQNQMGEMLFKTIALQRADTGAGRVARRVIAERLRSWGAAPDGFLVWDGSGLSRQDLVSPETLVRVLDAMRRGPFFTAYYDAFPVAGVDGTLRTRMRATPAEGNVRGKTGTLSNVRSLSGYVTTADGRLVLFSVLGNHYLVSTDYISRIQDAIAIRLSRLRG